MAKLKAPLLSLGASGQLGKTMVHFNWKGLNVVREYVVPSNPQTAAQVTQRGYVTAAVALVHDALARVANPLDSDDQVAYAALASAKGKVMTWFNQAVKLYIDAIILSDVPIVYCNGQTLNTAPATFGFEVYLEEETASQLAAGKFYVGTSKTNLIHAITATVNAGASAYCQNYDASAFMTAGNKYFIQFRPDTADPCEGSDSGIYNFLAT